VSPGAIPPAAAEWSSTRRAPRRAAVRSAPETARQSGRRTAVLLVLLLVAAGALASGTWAYAGRLDADVLQVRSHSSAPVRGDLLVTSAADGQVALRRDDELQPDPLRTADVYGLAWTGGRGVLSGPAILQPDGEVVRDLKVTDGRPPVAGLRAVLDRSVWADPQSAYGVAFRQVPVPCAGGRCPAWYVPGRGSTWMVLVHGRGASRTEPLRALGPAVHAGMPALDIGYRNDVGAPRDPSGRYGYGTTEWRDLDAAVRWATGHGARHVVLFGASMGGSIVAAFLEHSTSASRVSGVVLDAPALDLRGLVDAVNEAHRRVPVVGMPIPRALTAAAEQVASWRYGVDWSAADYGDGDWLRVPALVFQGTADRTVPPATNDRLRADRPDLVQEVRVRGAAHVQSWNVDPAAYEARETAFLRCVTGAVPTSTCRP
jgi:pimeloyl-ACP methyl ester carboxylesterase